MTGSSLAQLPKLAGRVDVVHVWPLGALRDAQRRPHASGIPTVLERPNAHTRFAYEVVAAECERLGITLPPDHEHAYNAEILRHEEEEYELADYLLCPSDFVVKTFRDQGFPQEKLLRHTYGFDPSVFFAAGGGTSRTGGADGPLRRRGGRPQGPASRARGVAALAGIRGLGRS